jgi:hypothetical protein
MGDDEQKIYIAERASDLDLATHPPYILKPCAKCGETVACTLRDYLSDRWVNMETGESDPGEWTAVWCTPCLLAELGKENAT